MYPSSSLLTLPLEIRQHIYSYLLIDKGPQLFLWCYPNYSIHFLSHTCRQLYHEVIEYYFAMNVLELSLAHDGYRPDELAAWPKERLEYLEYHLRRVQHLQIKMTLWHRQQAKGFRGALIRARQGTAEDCWLKSLDIQLSRLSSWCNFLISTADRGIDKEMTLLKFFLQPFRGLAGKLTFHGREVMLDDDEDV